MKNTILFISILLLTITVKAEIDIPSLNYQVKSDKKDESVLLSHTPKGYTLIYGKATKNNKPIVGVRISTLNHEVFTVTKKDGSYSFLIKSTDTALYAYKPKNNEIVINNYNFKSQHKVEIDFYLQQNIDIRVVSKPVIYLYPTDKKDIKLKLKTKGDLTFTYPVYKDSWSVTALPNGTITKGNKTYPYLFWESQQEDLTFTKNKTNEINGYFIKTDTIVSFLENRLNQLGLTNKESTDFLTFWAPKMQKKEYAYIQFILDDEYNSKIASLSITPKPTAIKRICMLYSLTKNEASVVNIKKQILPSFKRKGFTVIEWGGSEVDIPFEN